MEENSRRKRNSHRKRIKKTNNKRRGEKRKAEYRDFFEKMDNVSRRKPVEMINIKDRTDYQFSDSNIDLCGKGQKFVPKPMRIDLIKKHEDFISFSRKMRLKIYFDNRNRDYSSESNVYSEASGVEEPPISYEGHTQWARPSNFTPKAGDNEALEYFLMQVYQYLFNHKNRKWVNDNLTSGERDSLRAISKWNKDHQNPRVVRVEDKGSGFVIDWKENYFRECSEFISDESTSSKDHKDRSEENKEKVRQWATKWRKEEVISGEEEDWVIVNQPNPARLYANIKTHKENWPYRFILSSRRSATVNLARWVECNLKDLATRHKAYIRDTKSFLLNLEQLNESMAPFPPHTRMISWDIKNFYPKCEIRLCIEAVRKALDKWKPRWSKRRKECICEAVEITMTSNNGCIAGQYFMQIDGATIGGPDSASITDIFGGQFIDPVAEWGMKTNAGEILKPLGWNRYRDDTFDIEIGELANPENVYMFTEYLNEEVCKRKIIFEPDSDPNQLAFLDTRVNLSDGFLRPVIYSKPTDARRYLDPASCHPAQVNWSNSFVSWPKSEKELLRSL